MGITRTYKNYPKKRWFYGLDLWQEHLQLTCHLLNGFLVSGKLWPYFTAFKSKFLCQTLHFSQLSYFTKNKMLQII
uniref:Uncharacterized protein n=1 Tax=uncultured marine crenarchaeote HF4000_ANIW141J13 TaxID=455577 RepID=B3T5L0_9ARCH|nr:hypothetical protein ALOHA_HF4000ANIW141J13ctg1g38 [uncultured marine crenarchaeote HF4000_ANIW141J13]